MFSRDLEQPSVDVGSSRWDISCAFDFIVVRPGVAGEPLNLRP